MLENNTTRGVLSLSELVAQQTPVVADRTRAEASALAVAAASAGSGRCSGFLSGAGRGQKRGEVRAEVCTMSYAVIDLRAPFE